MLRDAIARKEKQRESDDTIGATKYWAVAAKSHGHVGAYSGVGSSRENAFQSALNQCNGTPNLDAANSILGNRECSRVSSHSFKDGMCVSCLLYTSPSPRDRG